MIEQLQQFAAQAAQDAKEDDSASMIDEDLEELNPQYNVLFPALPCIFQNENFCLCCISLVLFIYLIFCASCF